jgi:Ice-binding-like
MKLTRHEGQVRRVRLAAASVAAVGLLVALPGNAQAAAVRVPLGTADSFVVLAGAGITNTGPTTLNGDIGSYANPKITGAGLTVTGVNHAGDAVTQGAKTALVTAYNKTAGEGPTSSISGDLNGRILLAGVYNSASSIGLRTGGRLILDAAKNPNAVFVFQAGSTVTTGSGSQILLRNGARSCNVFWQVGSSATLGTNSTFVGTVMAQESITVTTGARVVGRVLARTGAVTLDTNRIIRPTSCAATGTTGGTGTDTTGGTGTGSQVGQVPTGGVSSGDGSTAVGGDRAQGLLAGGLLLAGLGGAVVVAARRRRLNT